MHVCTKIKNMCRRYNEKEIQYDWNNKSNKPKCNPTYIHYLDP